MEWEITMNTDWDGDSFEWSETHILIQKRSSNTLIVVYKCNESSISYYEGYTYHVDIGIGLKEFVKGPFPEEIKVTKTFTNNPRFLSNSLDAVMEAVEDIKEKIRLKA